MKPPATITIGAHAFRVEVVDSKLMADQAAAIELNELAIGVAGFAPPSKQREHILHEVLHGVLFAAGITYDHPCAKVELDGELEERIVSRAAPILLEVIRRNPQLVKYLTEPDR